MLASFTSFLPSALQVSSPDHTNKQFRPDDDDKGQTDDDEPKHSDAMAVDEVGVKKKKDRTANETFIFVRPPPAKSNHPLNLQVQLVPPNSRAPGGVTGSANSHQSFDFNASVPSTPNSPDTGATPTFGEQQRVSQETTSGSTLSRTTSNRSEASMYSGYSSVASFSSVASSNASGRRMIIPLYNLQAHNVMTNVIVDAGTDAKVAKFMKRGMEMIDLAILEPIEVWGAGSGAIAPTGAGGARGSVDDGQGQATLFRKSSQFLQPGGRPPSRPVTPDTPGSSRLSVSSSGFDPHLQHHPAIQIVDAPPPSSKRNIFGKLFKKKDAGPITTTPTHSRTPSVPTTATISSTLEAAANTTPTPSRHARRQSTSTKAQLPSSPLPVDPETPTNSSILRPPVLGIQPTLSSPSYPPRGRPNMYVWIVRRWLKGGEGGILGGMMGKLGGVGAGVMSLGIGGNSGSAQNLGLIEVRFEWKRGKSGKKKAKGLAPKKAASTTGSANGSRRGSAIIASASNTSLNGKTGNGSPTAPQFQDRGRDKERNNRLSVISHHSISTTVTSEDNHDSPPSGSPARRARSRERERDRGEKDTDDGEESDPEDSETPWTCTLKVRRLPPPVTPRALSPRHASSFTGQQLGEEAPAPQIIRVKVGTLSPTPHHPKVVAMLKVPFPLPDIEVEQMSVRRRRVLGPNGVVISGGGGGESGGGGAGLELTAEEIKDVVCSTGMWLVVREGFGGVGKVSRKGDGWRIRA